MASCKPQRLTLTLLITALALTDNPATAQAADAAVSADRAAASPDPGEIICLSSRHQIEKITVGRGPKQIEITLGGGMCEPPGLGISDLWVRYPDEDGMLDVVLTKDCPAFSKQVALLRASKAWRVTGSVGAGPFVVDGRRGLFELRSAKGRSNAARWIRQTLDVVRPCWNTVRQDRTRMVVDTLYRRLEM